VEREGGDTMEARLCGVVVRTEDSIEDKTEGVNREAEMIGDLRVSSFEGVDEAMEVKTSEREHGRD